MKFQRDCEVIINKKKIPYKLHKIKVIGINKLHY